MKTAFALAAKMVALPFNGISKIGNFLTGKLFDLCDRTFLGRLMEAHCYKIAGPSFIVGDLGYIGFALEQGSAVQITGALCTLPAHMLLTFVGDREPLLLKLANKMPTTGRAGQLGSAVRLAAESLTRRDRALITTAWGLLAMNGVGLLGGGIEKIGETARLDAVPFDAVSVMFIGAAIALGCSTMAGMEFVKRGAMRNPLLSQDERAVLQQKIQRAGHYALGIFSSTSVLNVLTALSCLSPSLAVGSAALMLGNYCQRGMTRPHAVPLKEAEPSIEIA